METFLSLVGDSQEKNEDLSVIEARIHTHITPGLKRFFAELSAYTRPPEAINKVTTSMMLILFPDTQNTWTEAKKKLKSFKAFTELIVKTQNEKIPIGRDRMNQVETILSNTPNLGNQVKNISVAGYSLYLWTVDFINILKLRST